MNKSQSETGSGIEDRQGKYLTFQLGSETYGLTILKVREIIGMVEVTRVPSTPPFVRGVINRRGRIIPVVDLRVKFGRRAHEDIGHACVIVLQLERCGTPLTVGVIVDEVSEVLEIHAGQLSPRPSLGDGADLDFIAGTGKAGR